jgi:prepilin-type N-terminal cleavage/methylation domain-containing protein
MSPTCGNTRRIHAFTLIELLIVVAIIAILAAIAVPNFLEAQVRAKVSRVKADQRSLATAIESYMVDNNKYPASLRATNDRWTATPTRTEIYGQMTTPIAYITSAFQDPFNSFDTDAANRTITYWGPDTFGVVSGTNPYTITAGSFNNNYNVAFSVGFPSMYDPAASQLKTANTWVLLSLGPDRRFDILFPDLASTVSTFPSPLADYDPTNGTVSRGDVLRLRQ